MAAMTVLRVISLMIGVLGLCMALANWAPASPAAAVVAKALPMARVYAEEAEQALRARPGAPGAYRALPASTREIAVAPDRLFPPLRRAFILARLQRGKLGAQGLAQLDRSYALARYDLAFGVWRCLFAFEHWDELTPATRRKVGDEFSIMWKTNGRDELRAGSAKLTNRTGRFALALLQHEEQARPKPNVMQDLEDIRQGRLVMRPGGSANP